METLLRRSEVEARIGLPKSTLYHKMRCGESPKPIKIGKQAVAWPSSRVDR